MLAYFPEKFGRIKYNIFFKYLYIFHMKIIVVLYLLSQAISKLDRNQFRMVIMTDLIKILLSIHHYCYIK